MGRRGGGRGLRVGSAVAVQADKFHSELWIRVHDRSALGFPDWDWEFLCVYLYIYIYIYMYRSI